MATIDMSSYTDTQDALDNVTRDSTNGDVFEYPDGWTETLTGNLDYSLYGTPTSTAPLEFRALGACDIDLSTYSLSTGIDHLIFRGIDFEASGHVFPATTSQIYATCVDCTFNLTGTGSACSLAYNRGYMQFVRCYFYGTCTRFVRTGPAYFWDCVIQDVSNFSSGTDVHFYNCVILNTVMAGSEMFAQRCTFVGDGTTKAITGTSALHVEDCVFKGFTTAVENTSVGTSVVRNNTFFNCTTSVDITSGTAIEENNTTTTSDPLPDSVSGDYSTANVSNNYNDRGAVGAGSKTYTGGSNGRGAVLSYPNGSEVGSGSYLTSGSLEILGTPDTEYYVDGDNGSDSNTGLSEGQAWATLAYASTTMTYGTITRLNVKAASSAYAANDWNPNNGTNNLLLVQGYTTTPGDGGKPTLQRTTGTYLLTTGHADGNIAFRHLRFEDGNCAVNTYGFAWYLQCDFHNASVTGSLSVREDYHYVVGCTFTSTGDQRFATDATCKYCLFDGSNMTGQDYMVSRGGPEISDCVFIIKDGCGGIGNSHNKESRVTRCLFLGDESGTGGRGGTGYEGTTYQGAMTTLTNCVFADLTLGIEAFAYKGQLVGGNLFYNCGTNTGSITSKIKLQDFVVSEHPVPRRASGDYRISLPSSPTYSSQIIPSTFGPAGLPAGEFASGPTFHPMAGS
jgi:hypothetical protein